MLNRPWLIELGKRWQLWRIGAGTGGLVTALVAGIAKIAAGPPDASQIRMAISHAGSRAGSLCRSRVECSQRCEKSDADNVDERRGMFVHGGPHFAPALCWGPNMP